MFRRAFCVSVLFTTFGTVWAASPNPDSLKIPSESITRAQSLIRDLGSDVYRDREKATRELRQMGRQALPVLAKSALSDTDPEVRSRCAWLIPLAEADDMAARVAAFLADSEGKFTHDLPGWNRFKEVVGADRTSRTLFADMVKSRENQDLLLATQRTPEELGRSISARRQQIQILMSPPDATVPVRTIMPTLPDIATLLFTESLVPEQLAPPGGYQYHVSNYFYQPDGRNAVGGNGPHGPAFRKLTFRWLDTRDGPNGAMTAMNIAQNLGLGASEISKHAARSLAIEGMHPWNKSSALVVIARNGSKEQLPAMLKTFKDETLLVRGGLNAQHEIQVRDVALVMALVLTNQEPKSYGFTLQTPENQSKFNSTAYAFRDEPNLEATKKRDAAFKQWEKWAETHLQDGKLKVEP